MGFPPVASTLPNGVVWCWWLPAPPTVARLNAVVDAAALDTVVAV